MRFIDEATIRISAGHGGPGCVSFRRETFVPRGGPDGGDGGDGGDVVFVASAQLGTLQDFRFKREYSAPGGNHGSGANKAGRDGETIEIRVPVGTTIRDVETGEIYVDFAIDGERWVACEGGRGGKGNAHFVSSTFQAPKFAQEGEVGEFKEIKLELKLIADAAIIGFPNAGKSTLISRISAAHPKIADYPFTTLTPNLGVVSLGDYQSFVVADIPGLIEGAHRGLGLGHKFLKHIERTRVFVHLLDGTQILEDATKPEATPRSIAQGLIQRYQAIRNELGLFNEALLHKPEIVALNKTDLMASDQSLLLDVVRALRDELSSIRKVDPRPLEPFLVSCASGAGIQELLGAVFAEITEAKRRSQRAEVLKNSPEGLTSDLDAPLLPDSEALRRRK